MGQVWGYLQEFAAEPMDLRLSKFKLFSKQTKEVCQVLRLDQNAQRDLFDFFNELDADQSGEIDYHEFLDRLCLKDTKMTERVFLTFDTDGTGDIDFKEFVIQAWNIVTRTERMLIQLLFDIFDDDGNEFLSPAECIALLKMINGDDSEHFDQQQLQRLMHRIDTNHDGQISFDELVAFCKINTLFIEPIRDLQRRLRHSICGPEYWHTMSEWRVLHFGLKADIVNILELNSQKGTHLKKMKDADNIAQLEDKRQEMMVVQAERAKQLIERCRRMTEREMILLVVYSSRRHMLVQQSLQGEMTDIEQQRNRYKRGQLTASIQELYADMDMVFELEFKKVETDAAAAAEQSAVDFLASPIGDNVVAAAADSLAAKAEEDTATSGNRLLRRDAEELVRSKLKDTLLSQSQHQLLSDYTRMKAMQADERKGISARIGVYDAGVLTLLATGQSTVLAAALGWPVAAVDKAKGTWFEMEFSAADSNEYKVDENLGVLRAEGFMSPEANRYHKAAGKLAVITLMDKPRCPKCGHEGSSKLSKFCRMCGAHLVQIEWSDAAGAVQYRFTENGMTTLHSPFEQHVTDEYVQQGLDLYNDSHGKAIHNPDVNLLGLQQSLEQKHAVHMTGDL